MLVLTRRVGERIRIGDGIVVTIVSTRSGRARVGIEAPAGFRILREEVVCHGPMFVEPGGVPPVPISVGIDDDSSTILTAGGASRQTG